MKKLLFLVFMLTSFTAQAGIKLELNGFLHESQKHVDPRKRPRTYIRQIPLSKEDKDFAKRTISKAINLLPMPIREMNLKKNIKIIFWNFEKTSGREKLGDNDTFSNEIRLTYKHIKKRQEKELIKNFIHEIGHTYDDLHEVSARKDFRTIFGWHERGILFLRTNERRNVDVLRSVDVYEQSSPEESFSVNMEYFTTDSEYKCRMPLQYEYLAKLFGIRPFKDTPCSQSFLVPLSSEDHSTQGYWYKIDPSRLYQIHYFYADGGDGIESKWGHAMLRLVMCSPERTKKTKDCLKDVHEHIVLSYRANIDDIILNPFKGILGGYDSKLFLIPFQELVEEYTEREFRNLISVPLKMNREEKRRVLDVLRQEAWGYTGQYRFITNNCATETLDFLKLVYNRPEINDSYANTPEGVLNLLNELAVIEISSLNKNLEQRLRSGHYFLNKRQAYQDAYYNFRRYMEQYQHESIDDFLSNTRIQDIQGVINNIASPYRHKISSEDKIKLLSALATILYYKIFKIEQERKTKLLELYESGQIPKSIEAIVRMANSSAENIQGLGYGIPSEKETQVILRRQNDLHQKIDPQNYVVFKKFFEKHTRKEKVEQNLYRELLEKVDSMLINLLTTIPRRMK